MSSSTTWLSVTVANSSTDPDGKAAGSEKTSFELKLPTDGVDMGTRVVEKLGGVVGLVVIVIVTGVLVVVDELVVVLVEIAVVVVEMVDVVVERVDVVVEIVVVVVEMVVVVVETVLVVVAIVLLVNLLNIVISSGVSELVSRVTAGNLSNPWLANENLILKSLLNF